MEKARYKRLFHKFKHSFRKRLPPIKSGDKINYTNIGLIIRFISQQGKILSRRVNRLTSKQQRLMTSAIKQARILSLLPFHNNENLLKLKTAKSTTKIKKTKVSIKKTKVSKGHQTPKKWIRKKEMDKEKRNG